MKRCPCCLGTFEATRVSAVYCVTCNRKKQYEWRQKNPERWAELSKRSRTKRRENPLALTKIRARGVEYWRKLRIEVMDAYGGAKCACCGETEEKFLSIDHVHNDGASHRRQIGAKDGNGKGAATRTLTWIKQNGFPAGFQVLCMNCNFGKARNGGVCPHAKRDRHLVSVA